ncbi:hypothetical protein [Streptomyces sp. NPDC002530]
MRADRPGSSAGATATLLTLDYAFHVVALRAVPLKVLVAVTELLEGAGRRTGHGR